MSMCADRMNRKRLEPREVLMLLARRDVHENADEALRKLKDRLAVRRQVMQSAAADAGRAIRRAVESRSPPDLRWAGELLATLARIPSPSIASVSIDHSKLDISISSRSVQHKNNRKNRIFVRCRICPVDRN